MLRVALTGGIGTGKSAVLATLAGLGAHVIVADLLAREVIEPGTSGEAAVLRRFGPAVIDAGGRIDRARLGALVFRDQTALRDLEAIVHPRVYDTIRDWMAARAVEGAQIAVAEIPLLFETHHEADFDRVVVTACEPAEQVRRVMARDGLSGADVQRRIAAQWPLEDKARRADFVIRTDGSMVDTARRTSEVWRALLALDTDHRL